MDKKNTMLLTVIAVATLLVAVVGATFAYFNVTSTNNSSETVITGKTSSVPSATLTGNQSLKLTLTADNMSQANIGKYYYATATEAAAQESTSSPDNHKLNVGTVTLSGGETGEEYECTANYKITITPTNINFDATKDEAKLFFYGEDGVTLPSEFNSGVGVNLNELNDADTEGVTGEVKFKLTANGSTSEKKLQAALQIKNSNEERQLDLAGKEFTIKMESTSFTCAPTATE